MLFYLGCVDHLEKTNNNNNLGLMGIWKKLLDTFNLRWEDSSVTVLFNSILQ